MSDRASRALLKMVMINLQGCMLVSALASGVISLWGCSLSVDPLDEGPEQKSEVAGSSSRQPILGGRQVESGQFPTTVVLEISEESSDWLCTGTLIAPNLVLTAAHCFVDSGTETDEEELARTMNVIFDAVDVNDLSSGSETQVGVEEIIVHSQYYALEFPDMALVRLAQPITDREFTPINFNAEDAPIGISVTAVGYGIYNAMKDVGIGFFLENQNSVSCLDYGYRDHDFLCFDQSTGEGKCQGDSGGPAFAEINGVNAVVAIASEGDAECMEFGVEARTDANRDFFAIEAPEILCRRDNLCEDACAFIVVGSVPKDPDCASSCANDSDCANSDLQCDTDNGLCKPRPQTLGGLGSLCTNSDECSGSLCLSYERVSRCAARCSDDDDQCPNGFDCLDNVAGFEGNVCWPRAREEEGGGCAAGGSSALGMGGMMVLAHLLAWVLRRRRIS